MTRSAPKTKGMSIEELHALPVAVDLVTAGRALSIGRSTAYDLANAGQFPCRILRIGNIYRVPRADLFRALGIGDDATAPDGELAHAG